MVFEAVLACWSEGLAKGPYQKNTPPAVRLEPAIYRSRIRAFYKLSHTGRSAILGACQPNNTQRWPKKNQKILQLKTQHFITRCWVHRYDEESLLARGLAVTAYTTVMEASQHNQSISRFYRQANGTAANLQCTKID